MTEEIGSHAHANRLLREAVEENGRLRRELMEVRALNDRLAASLIGKVRRIEELELSLRAEELKREATEHALERIMGLVDNDAPGKGGHA